MRLEVKKTWHIELGSSGPLIPFLLHHAMFLFNRFQARGPQKKTAYENVLHKVWNGKLGRMTETVMGRLPDALKRGKLKARWVY